MAEALTIARPYAKAVFEQALADKSLDQWGQALKILAEIAKDQQVAVLLTNPLIESSKLLKLFGDLTEKLLPDLTSDRRKQLVNFLTVLINEKRLAVLPDILRRYERLLTAQQELKSVTVTSAYSLSEPRRSSMIASLKKYFKSEVTVDFEEDPTLIGGAIIRSGNWVMDGSIKGKLQNLRDGLMK
ncbi:MAG: F0F1 ATP synthase subunit delta [Proteobacteria bacterium]|nr:F0F1 ATP synthase subunit delta [Pseudomonadota bacterium]